MRYITIGEALGVYERVMDATGGLMGIRDLGALESAIAQPYMTFDGNELYPSLAEKAAALGFSHDQPAFRTFSVISLSAARARIGVRPLLCKLP